MDLSETDGSLLRDVEATKPPAGAWSSTITLINCAVGAGVLSFPFAFQCTGWAAGLAVTIMVALVEAFTLYVLSRYAEHTHSSNYSELVRKMLGPWWAALMSAVLFLYIWGSAVAYLIILGDCFQPLLHAAFGEAWFTQRSVIILAFSCAFVLPLCFPRTLSAIAGVSALTLYGLVVVVGAVMVRSMQLMRSDPDPWRDVQAFSHTWQFFSALPIAVFGFQCHTNVIAVFDELGDTPVVFTWASAQSLHASSAGDLVQAAAAGGYTELPSARRAKCRRRPKSPKLMGMMWVVMVAIGITCFFYCCVGTFGYLAFPTTVQSNILLNFPSSDKMMQVTRAVVGVIEIASYPVMHHPARAAVRDMLFQATGRHLGGMAFNIVETLLFFSSTLAVSLLVSDLGIVFRLVGGTGGGLLILMIPGMLLIQYSYGKHTQSKQLQQGPLLTRSRSCGARGGARGEGKQGGKEEAEEEVEGQGLSPEGGQELGFEPRQWPLQADLSPWHDGLGGGLEYGEVYRYWTSKLWWAGVVLVLLSLALCALTVYTVFATAQQA